MPILMNRKFMSRTGARYPQAHAALAVPLIILVCLPLFLSAGPYRAFTAVTEESMVSGNHTVHITSTYYAAPGELRVDTQAESSGRITSRSSIITLYGANKVTTILLYPRKRQYLMAVESRKTYRADASASNDWLFSPPGSSEGVCARVSGTCKKIGSGMVLGRRVEEWLVAIPDGKGGTVALHLWYDPALHFVVQSDLAGMTTTRIHLGRPDPALFRIPSGYTQRTSLAK